jgi:hypothetical protein
MKHWPQYVAGGCSISGMVCSEVHCNQVAGNMYQAVPSAAWSIKYIIFNLIENVK